MSVGIFDSGLSFISPAWGVVIAATVRTQVMRPAMPRSCATIMTLRTNGERGDQWSFMERPRERILPGAAILGANVDGGLTFHALAFCMIAARQSTACSDLQEQSVTP